MITKSMRQSSRKAMDAYRQFGHGARSYNFSPSKYEKVAATNKELTWWERFKDWLKQLVGGR